MLRRSALLPLVLLVWLLLCPLAAAGVFSACHDNETAMDCCELHQGSAAQPSAKVLNAAALPAAPLPAEALEPSLASTPSARELPPPAASGPRIHSRNSVFLI